MREILFRGKRIDNGEWIEGYLLLCDERVFILPWGVVGCWHFDWLKKGEYIFGKFIEVIPKTIGQYTGLTDKNGKRIFEGDIWDCQGYKGVIKWNDDDCAFEATYTVGGIEYANAVNSKRAKSAKVIGNIHDNPELLKGENK